MEPMDDLSPEIARLFDAKERRRHTLAALSFPDKVRIVVRMQRMAAPLLHARGRPARVWPLEYDEPDRETWCAAFIASTHQPDANLL